MKKRIIFMLFAITFGTSAYSITETEVKSTVTEAKVFLNGAQVFRTGKATIKKGTTKLVFTDISPNLNPKSIQASGKGNFLILDVKHNIHYPEPSAVKAAVLPERIQREINQLNDSLLLKGFEVERVVSKRTNLSNEKKMIITNKLMTGGGHSDSLPVLKDAVDFYRKKLDEIDDKLFAIKLKEHRMKEQQRKMQGRLKELKNYNAHVGQPVKEKKNIHQIIVTISSEVETSAKIKVSYLVSNAGWVPAYDLRANTTAEPMTLTYKARVFQKTGEDWSNVKLTLSTYNQDCSLSKPFLAAWELKFMSPDQRFMANQKNLFNEKNNSGYKTTDNNFASNTQLNTNIATSFNDRAMSTNFSTNVGNTGNSNAFNKGVSNFSLTNQAYSNVEFEIKTSYTIPPDGEEILMVVKNDKLDANFDHFVIPKVNKDAFLLAKIGDWESLSLLQAKANIYFDNTFVGETYINPMTIADTLELAMGRDKAIYTTRKKTSDKTKTTALGKNKERTITIELVVKNNKTEAVELDLEDQVPISRKEEIKVKMIDNGGGELNKNSGTLKWTLNLQPKEVKKITFTYTLEYDKHKNVM
jgi:uncharacterized protein (TIGR02231 family)